MPLPTELNSIFKNKQKSYKMVLILAILDELEQTGQRLVSLTKVKQQFLAYYIQQDQEGNRFEHPPEKLASKWEQLTSAQLNAVLDTPLQVLGHILEVNPSQDFIGFKLPLWERFQPQTLVELRQYALVELEQYQRTQETSSKLQSYLNQVLEGYVQAKRQPITNHPMGMLFRQTIPQALRSLPFMLERYKIQGSVGMGNWADVPWIAIMDRRLTETTQRGEYLVYLFDETMDSVYLTFNQGVTLPLQEKGKKAGHEHLGNKVKEIRQLIALESFTKDDQIHLTNKGIGESYQIAAVAYKKYERGAIPTDTVLIEDLRRLVEDYKVYVELALNQSDTQSHPMFRYTMSHIYYGQGILHFLARTPMERRSLDDMIQNYAEILKSAADVQHPKERITHVGRALQDLGLLEISDNQYGLTDLGSEYVKHFNEDIWFLSNKQAELLRSVIKQAHTESSELLQIIKASADLARELGTFTVEAFQPLFIATNGETGWNEVTKVNRTKFMLNWLEDLKYIEKKQNQYVWVEEVPVVDEIEQPMNVKETVEHIAQYIAHQGFQYPDRLIENFYLSLKTKPFVILAGISGTGKTKLVKLFAEALGATSENHQFTLIPVRPDWSDPSDLLGYQDLSRIFRPGPLTTILLEASRPANRRKPYFICLDEMNLARVEHYFSDILSILETQHFNGTQIVTDRLLPKETLSIEQDLIIPDNVYIIGTINMDETTHPFSKKVLDRANTIEFNYIRLEDFPSTESEQAPLVPTLTSNRFLRSDYLQLKDAYTDYQELTQKTTRQLVTINIILEDIHSHIGFRVRDSICFYMIYNQRFELMSEEDAFDIQLLQKILPRIQGSSRSVKRVILELLQICVKDSLKIDSLMDDATELYEAWRPSGNAPAAIYPQSARKLAYMLRRLEEDGFTSFWLS